MKIYPCFFNFPVKYLLLVIVFCAALNVHAQSSGTKGINYDDNSWYHSDDNRGGGFNANWGVVLNAGYDMPGKNLSETYKAAPTFGLGVLKNWNDFTFNLNVGYLSYAPKLDKIPFPEPYNGYIEWKPLKIYQLYAGAAYNFYTSGNTKVYGGLNAGTYYINQSFQFVDDLNDETSYGREIALFVAPKLGFVYQLNQSVGLGLEGKYNVFSYGAAAYSTEGIEQSTISNTSFAANVMLVYNF